jgi:hypothetical protein
MATLIDNLVALVKTIKADVTALYAHVGTGGAAHAEAVAAGAAGVLSGSDKAKLDGIDASANNYSHPANHSPSIITQDASNRFVTDAEKSTWSGKQDALGFTPATSSHDHSGIYEPVLAAGTSSQYYRGDKTWAAFPASLPSSDVYAWAKAVTKPAYSASEVEAEAFITKATGYAKWTGSAWSFVNETYSLSSHNHNATYQPLDATLTALAGVTTAADRLIYATGADAFAVTPLTAAGRALIDDADAAAQRTTIGLGTAATRNASDATTGVVTHDLLGRLAYAETVFVPVPATATSPGEIGDIACNSTHAYFCIARNTWVRAAVATW